jgi:hypothetical protein
LVRSPEQMPGSPRRLHILSPTEYLVAYDPTAGDDPDLLTAAYLRLRAHAWAAVLDDHDGTDIDLPAVRAGLADALQALSGFDTLSKHSASARKQLDDLDKATATLRASLRGRLENTLRLLDPSQPAAPAQQTAAA